MLQSRIQTALDKRRDGESGFTLIELLVVVIIIGILSSIAIPVFLGQRQRAFDAGVQSDMKNLATAAETNFAATLGYPVAAVGFSTTNPGAVIATKGNHFEAFVTPTGQTAGYVIIGWSDGSSKIFISSSFNGGAPTDSGVATVAAAEALLTAGSATYGNPLLYSAMTKVVIVA